MLYKVFNITTGAIELSINPDNNQEVIEEIEVPEGYEAEEYQEFLEAEVNLGDMCEQSTNY